MSKSVPKPRINKFIFQDGKVFLRVKTTARSLKLKKQESNYSIDFVARRAVGETTSIPVVFIEDSQVPETLHADAEKTSKSESWGSLLRIKTPGENSQTYYYATPENKKFAVRIGPISANIDNSDLEIDWPNIQWGIE